MKGKKTEFIIVRVDRAFKKLVINEAKSEGVENLSDYVRNVLEKHVNEKN